MPTGDEPILSAQVILRSATGRSLEAGVMITAKNVAEYLPSPKTISMAEKVFRSEGFEVGPFVGVSFSITGPLRTFERSFGLRVQRGDDHAFNFMSGSKPIGHELSGSELPGSMQEHVQRVAFPLPPDFGPKEF